MTTNELMIRLTIFFIFLLLNTTLCSTKQLATIAESKRPRKSANYLASLARPCYVNVSLYFLILLVIHQPVRFRTHLVGRIFIIQTVQTTRSKT